MDSHDATQSTNAGDQASGMDDIEEGIGILCSIVALINGLSGEEYTPTASAIKCMTQKAGGLIERGMGSIAGKPAMIVGSVEEWMA